MNRSALPRGTKPLARKTPLATKPLASGHAVLARRARLEARAPFDRESALAAHARTLAKRGIAYAALIRSMPCPACPDWSWRYRDRAHTEEVVRAAFLLMLDGYTIRVSESNHIIHSQGNGGLAADTCPTCHDHHTADGKSWHRMGPDSFKRHYGVDLRMIATWIAESKEGRQLLSIDARIARARELDVKRVAVDRGARKYHVTGGREPHTLFRYAGGFVTCDCKDFTNGHTCAHVVGVRLYEREKPREIALAMVGEVGQ